MVEPEAGLPADAHHGAAGHHRAPSTSRRAPEQIYPYLLAKADLSPAQPGVAADITYLPMARLDSSTGGHGLASRYVVAWRVSNTWRLASAALVKALGRRPPSSTPTKAVNSPADSPSSLRPWGQDQHGQEGALPTTSSWSGCVAP